MTLCQLQAKQGVLASLSEKVSLGFLRANAQSTPCQESLGGSLLCPGAELEVYWGHGQTWLSRGSVMVGAFQ
jgi:hypothetical protein